MKMGREGGEGHLSRLHGRHFASFDSPTRRRFFSDKNDENKIVADVHSCTIIGLLLLLITASTHLLLRRLPSFNGKNKPLFSRTLSIMISNNTIRHHRIFAPSALFFSRGSLIVNSRLRFVDVISFGHNSPS